MALQYFDTSKDNYNVFVRNADTDELITTLPKASVPISSSSSVRVIALGAAIPVFSALWATIDWTKCDPPSTPADAVEYAQQMCIFFPSQVITLNFP